MTLKETVDKYLTKNFEEIDAQRVLNKEFRWNYLRETRWKIYLNF